MRIRFRLDGAIARAALCALLTGFGSYLTSIDPALALNCKEARAPVELAICGDAKLKAEDDALGHEYFETLRTLTGKRHDLLIEDQRHWLRDERTSGCDGKAADLVPCLTKTLPARRQTIAACFGNHPQAAIQCRIFLRSKCPTASVSVSAPLLDYPWMITPLVDNAGKSDDDTDCSPESNDDHPGTADQNDSSLEVKLLAKRPGVIAVRIETDWMSRGAAHPQHGESIKTYDLRTHKEIPVAAVLPGLKPGSKLLATISKAAAPTLVPPCCYDDNDFNHTFGGLGFDSEQPMPDSWSIAENGDLVLGYDYMALGRDFMATATVPRKLVEGAIAPAYASLFVPEAGSPPR